MEFGYDSDKTKSEMMHPTRVSPNKGSSAMLIGTLI